MLPLVLANQAFLTTLADVEAQVGSLKIVDAQTAQFAANLQIRLTEAGKKLEATRLQLKRPFIDISAKIDATARVPADRIEKAKAALRNAQVDWDAHQRKIAADAEAARQKELERLEKLRREEEAEAKRKTDELARIAAAAAAANKAPVEEIEFGDDAPDEPAPKTATELEIERVKFAPAPVVEKPAGITFRVSLRHLVENLAVLPETFVNKTANDTAIRATFCNGYRDGEPLPSCPGVKFWVERTPVSTGKSTF